MTATTATINIHPVTEDWFQRIGYGSMLVFVAALQFSIAIANIFLSLALLMPKPFLVDALDPVRRAKSRTLVRTAVTNTV